MVAWLIYPVTLAFAQKRLAHGTATTFKVFLNIGQKKFPCIQMTFQSLKTDVPGSRGEWN